MIVAVVNFPLPQGMSFDVYKAKMMETVPRYQGTEGLVRKNYIYDGDRRLGGAVYIFKSRANAEACFSEEWVKRVTAGYGKPDIRYFETPILIDNESRSVRDLTT